MRRRTPPSDLGIARLRIASKVRELRRARRWTQAEMARRLGLSQARLSEIENGEGSFTAEQLLAMLQWFNIDIGAFTDAIDENAELQNALARHGARHLRESASVLPTRKYELAADVVRAVLLDPRSERWVTALAPVLVSSIDTLGLAALQSDLVKAGVPDRLGWLVENVMSSLPLLSPARGTRWDRGLRRAETVMASFLRHLHPTRPPEVAARDSTPDPFDRNILSTKTLEQVWADASPISRRWGIASELGPEDFLAALREAHASDRELPE